VCLFYSLAVATIPLAAIKFCRDVNPGMFNALFMAGFGLALISAWLLNWMVLGAAIKLRNVVISSFQNNTNQMVKDAAMEIQIQDLVVRLARQQRALVLYGVTFTLTALPFLLVLLWGSVPNAYVLFVIATNYGWCVAIGFARNMKKKNGSMSITNSVKS
jgi:hypothetical protein